MTAKERIRTVLDGTKGPICDDCLAGQAVLSSRQHANAECRRLLREGEISRARGTCALCDGDKLVNRALASDDERATDMSVRASGSSAGVPQPRSTAQPLRAGGGSSPFAAWPPVEGATQRFGDYAFVRVCEIQPERDQAGQVRSFTPREQSRNPRLLPLHEYGRGPFCRFRVPDNLPLEGVYLLVVRGSVRYVGECENLSRRYNAGYGQISPRNCHIGGQSTNCTVNGLLFAAAERHDPIELWFCETDNRRRVERELIVQLRPGWNGQRRA
jgi:hypothetical protein